MHKVHYGEETQLPFIRGGRFQRNFGAAWMGEYHRVI